MSRRKGKMNVAKARDAMANVKADCKIWKTILYFCQQSKVLLHFFRWFCWQIIVRNALVCKEIKVDFYAAWNLSVFFSKSRKFFKTKQSEKFAKTKRVKVRTRIWTNKQFKMRVEKKIRKPTYVSTFLETFLALLEYENVNFRWSLRANSSWNTRIRWIRYLLSKTISLSSCAIRKSKLVLPAEVILRINPRKWGKARVTEGRKSFMWPIIDTKFKLCDTNRPIFYWIQTSFWSWFL